MNFESLPYEANNMLDVPTWNGKSYKNGLTAENFSQADWDLPSLNVLADDFSSLDLLPNKSLKGSNSVDCIASKSPLTTEKQEKIEAESSEEREMQIKVDFFRKLGYSSEEISVVLLKLGVNADTNTVLGELVKHGPAATDVESVAEAPIDYCLVARGGGSTPNPAPVAAAEENEGRQFKPVVIDGSNLAMSHGNKEVFSCRGISLAVDWFLERGHTDITVFVPSWRKEQPRPDVPIADQNILCELEKKKILVFTPSRRVGGKRVVCYDDRFIVKLAYESDGIVVSNDTYRDLQNERPEWKKFIEERLLMYSFVNDKFMPPDDPLGRHGPSLNNFLRKKAVVPEHRKPQCPYGKKCTYGIKCKFYHPERLNHPQRSVADELRANARLSPTKSTIGIPNEDKTKKFLNAEILSREPDEVPIQISLVERRNSSHKGRGSVSDCSIRGRTSSSVSSHDSDYGYESSEWHPPHAPQMDSPSYSSLGYADSGFVSSLESQMAEMWTCRSKSNCEHNEQMGSCRYCVCSKDRQTYHSAHGAKHDGYPRHHHHHHHHQNPHHHQDYQKPIVSSDSEGGLSPYIQDQTRARLSYSSHGFGRPEYQPPGKTRSLQNEYHPNSLTYCSDPPHYHPASTPAQYCSESHQPSHQLRSRDPHQFHGAAVPLTQWPQSDPFEKERLNTRTKLCGIFHPQLVDKVMNLNPRMVDPQRLAAEIFAYKSQNQGI